MIYAIATRSTPDNAAETASPADEHGSLAVRLYRDHAELEAIWRRLEKVGRCTVFQTYDWAACWYDTVMSCGAAEPLIVVVYDGARPIWIMPLCLYRRKGLRILSFADQGVSDYAAPVMADTFSMTKDAARAITDRILAALPPCDLVYFQKLADKVEDMPNPLLSLPGIARFPASCYGIRLDRPWPELAAKIMQPRLRSTIRRQKKRIEKQGAVTVTQDSRPDALTTALDRLMALRQARFDVIGREDMPPLWRNFYHMLAARQGRTLEVSVTTMAVAGEAVATCFGLTRNDAYHVLLPTFAMGKWEQFRPGMLLYDAMLAGHAIQTGNRGYFDFTIGDEPYKKRFGSESHPLYEWMAPRSALGLLPYLAWRLKIYLRRHPRIFAIARKALKRRQTI